MICIPVSLLGARFANRPMMLNVPEHIWQLISRKLAGEASEKDLRELDFYISENPEMKVFLEQAMVLWKTETQSTPAPDAKLAFSRHMERMKELTGEQPEPVKSIWRKKENMKESLYAFFNMGMFRNYFKVIFRNLYRFKSFSLINITGLAIGMASAVLILLLIQNELSYDQFHEKKDRIYMMFSRGMENGKMELFGTPTVFATVIKDNYPQVEEVTRLNGTGPIVLSTPEKQLEVHGMMVDPGFLKIFSYPLLRGNPDEALSSPRSVVLTEGLAKKLFVNGDAMGKTIRIDSNTNFIVTGILKNLPNNTEFDFEYLLPWSYMKEIGWQDLNWESHDRTTVVLLKPGVSEKTANDRFRNALKKYTPNTNKEVFVHPISKWRLWSRFDNGVFVGSGIESVRLFGLLAGFILLIACINYMNLSTARSVKRAKEVGIRKVVGAGRFSIMLRFLGESIMISLISVVVCLVIVQLGIRGFNWLTWNKLSVPYQNPNFWLGIIGFALFTGLVAGSYPAFYLSTFRPISVLKGTFKTSYNLVSIRKILVVLQFSFAITFIICTIIIYRQIDFGAKRDPGYQRDHLGFVYVKGDMNKKYEAIKNDLLKTAAVTEVTRSNSPICYTWRGDDRYTWTGSKPDNKIWFSEFYIDNNFTETMGLKIIAGRDMNTQTHPGDSTSVILNESAVKAMGFKDPIGQIIRKDKMSRVVVGVVKDFVSNSPFYTTEPMILQGPQDNFGAISFRLSRRNALSANMNTVESVFKKYIPDYPIISGYVDEADAKKMEDERRTGVQAALFGGMAILISCLGLFALAAYTAESRIKEIGIRKVLGASVSGITLLLSRDFVKLVVISFVIASPVAWWLMQSWLKNYTYRISIGWLVFAIAGGMSLLIAIATVSYQAIKAALSNPVVSLRAE
jgi:ABC-type antimicrobial peptide transport system permease subunit